MAVANRDQSPFFHQCEWSGVLRFGGHSSSMLSILVHIICGQLSLPFLAGISSYIRAVGIRGRLTGNSLFYLHEVLSWIYFSLHWHVIYGLPPCCHWYLGYYLLEVWLCYLCLDYSWVPDDRRSTEEAEVVRRAGKLSLALLVIREHLTSGRSCMHVGYHWCDESGKCGSFYQPFVWWRQPTACVSKELQFIAPKALPHNCCPWPVASTWPYLSVALVFVSVSHWIVLMLLRKSMDLTWQSVA
jgi:hypothetical protein